jgi:uncharacterized protein YktB (UPF0637 family)
MATRGAKKKSNHYDADESVKKDGAKSYSGSVQYGTFSNYTLSTLEIDGLQILPFDAQIKKGANSLPIRVFPFQIIPKDATLYKRTFAIALHLDKTVNPPQSDWPEATIQHEEKQQIHFSVPLADTGFFIEGQVITHK